MAAGSTMPRVSAGSGSVTRSTVSAGPGVNVQDAAGPRLYVDLMSDAPTDLPVFPTTAPQVFCDRDVLPRLFDDVLSRLAAVVDVDADHLRSPTPCVGFTVGELQRHVLGWLQFFAAALGDPTATSTRPDPESFTLNADAVASDVVRQARTDIGDAIAADAAGQMVTMSSARMAGDAVLAMALGEYIVHAWDLATATGQPYSAPQAAIEPAHEFLEGMIAPEYRGPDSGFFDHEVEVADDAPSLDKLLGFAGRNPGWSPAD